METKMRRQDRQLSESEVQSILANGEYGVLSMCNGEKGAYGIPLNYAQVGNRICFHGAADGTKLEAIRFDCRVSFCVVGKTKLIPEDFGTLYESVVVSGKASEVVDDEEKHAALTSLVAKYSPEFATEGQEYIARLYNRVKVLCLTIENVTGKARKQ